MNRCICRWLVAASRSSKDACSERAFAWEGSRRRSDRRLSRTELRPPLAQVPSSAPNMGQGKRICRTDGERLFPPCGGRMRSLGERSEPRTQLDGGCRTSAGQNAPKSLAASSGIAMHPRRRVVRRHPPNPNLPPQGGRGSSSMFDRPCISICDSPATWGRIEVGKRAMTVSHRSAASPSLPSSILGRGFHCALDMSRHKRLPCHGEGRLMSSTHHANAQEYVNITELSGPGPFRIVPPAHPRV